MNFEIKKKFSNTIKFLRRIVYKTNWVNLRNVNPISDDFGWSRGKPGGHLLLTVTGPTSHISKYDNTKWGDYWRFTGSSSLKSFEKVFGKGNVKVETYGNVLTSTAMMQGLSSNELTKDEVNYKDTSYPLIITVIAKKI